MLHRYFGCLKELSNLLFILLIAIFINSCSDRGCIDADDFGDKVKSQKTTVLPIGMAKTKEEQRDKNDHSKITQLAEYEELTSMDITNIKNDNGDDVKDSNGVALTRVVMKLKNKFKNIENGKENEYKTSEKTVLKNIFTAVKESDGKSDFLIKKGSNIIITVSGSINLANNQMQVMKLGHDDIKNLGNDGKNYSYRSKDHGYIADKLRNEIYTGISKDTGITVNGGQKIVISVNPSYDAHGNESYPKFCKGSADNGLLNGFVPSGQYDSGLFNSSVDVKNPQGLIYTAKGCNKVLENTRPYLESHFKKSNCAVLRGCNGVFIALRNNDEQFNWTRNWVCTKGYVIDKCSSDFFNKDNSLNNCRMSEIVGMKRGLCVKNEFNGLDSDVEYLAKSGATYDLNLQDYDFFGAKRNFCDLAESHCCKILHDECKNQCKASHDLCKNKASVNLPKMELKKTALTLDNLVYDVQCGVCAFYPKGRDRPGTFDETQISSNVFDNEICRAINDVSPTILWQATAWIQQYTRTSLDLDKTSTVSYNFSEVYPTLKCDDNEQSDTRIQEYGKDGMPLVDIAETADGDGYDRTRFYKNHRMIAGQIKCDESNTFSFTVPDAYGTSKLYIGLAGEYYYNREDVYNSLAHGNGNFDYYFDEKSGAHAYKPSVTINNKDNTPSFSCVNYNSKDSKTTFIPRKYAHLVDGNYNVSIGTGEEANNGEFLYLYIQEYLDEESKRLNPNKDPEKVFGNINNYDDLYEIYQNREERNIPLFSFEELKYGGNISNGSKETTIGTNIDNADINRNEAIFKAQVSGKVWLVILDEPKTSISGDNHDGKAIVFKDGHNEVNNESDNYTFVNSGSYVVQLATEIDQSPGAGFANFFGSIVSLVKDFFYGSRIEEQESCSYMIYKDKIAGASIVKDEVLFKTDSQDVSGYTLLNRSTGDIYKKLCDGKRDYDEGIIKKVAINITSSAIFQALFYISLVLFVTMYGYKMVAGGGEDGMMSMKEIVTTFVKLGFVFSVISPQGWNFYETYILESFIKMTDGMVDIAVSTISNKNLDKLDIDAQGFGPAGQMLAFMTEANTLKRLASIIWDSYAGTGFLFLVLLAAGFITFLVVALKSLIMYCSIIMTASLYLSVGPLFVAFAFHDKTKDKFETWWKGLAAMVAESFLMFCTISLFSMIIYNLYRGMLSFKICVRPILSIIGIPILWAYKKTEYSLPLSINIESTRNISTMAGDMSVSKCLSALIVCWCMEKYLDVAVGWAKSLGGGGAGNLGSLTGKLDKLSSAVTASSIASSPFRVTGSLANIAGGALKKNADKSLAARKEVGETRKSGLKAFNKAIQKELLKNPDAIKDKKRLREIGQAAMNKKMDKITNKKLTDGIKGIKDNTKLTDKQKEDQISKLKKDLGRQNNMAKNMNSKANKWFNDSRNIDDQMKRYNDPDNKKDKGGTRTDKLRKLNPLNIKDGIKNKIYGGTMEVNKSQTKALGEIRQVTERYKQNVDLAGGDEKKRLALDKRYKHEVRNIYRSSKALKKTSTEQEVRKNAMSVFNIGGIDED